MAPEVVRLCISSIRHHANGAKVVVLDKDNYKKYVSLPEHIMEKFGKGITVTELSDIIRMLLLRDYGGLWLDSTILCTKDIPAEIFDYSFYTLRLKDHGLKEQDFLISHGRWSIFAIGAEKGKLLFELVSWMLQEYWKTHTEIVDYFLTDYCINRCYEEVGIIREEVDRLPVYDGDKNDLLSRWKYIQSMDEIRGCFQKLNWKESYPRSTITGCLEDEYETVPISRWKEKCTTVLRKVRKLCATIFRLPRTIMQFGHRVALWNIASMIFGHISAKARSFSYGKRDEAVIAYLEKQSCFTQLSEHIYDD